MRINTEQTEKLMNEWKIKLVTLALGVLLTPVSVWAQTEITIDGRIVDAADKGPIVNALVKITAPNSPDNQIVAYTESDKNGRYRLRISTTLPEINLTFSMMGYRNETVRLRAETQTVDRELVETGFLLKEVTVKAPAISGRGDTINYNAAAFRSKADRTVEDILKKLPGITVHKSGKISYQGKPISKFYIEDLDMLGGKYNLATQNIPVGQITTVQIYENHQPIRLLKEIASPDEAALNIKLKNNKMSFPSGSILAGAGYSDRKLNRGELFGLMVDKNKQILFSGKANNLASRIRGELTDHYETNRFDIKAGTLIDPVSAGAPHPVGDRSGYYNNVITSLNTAKKINGNSLVKTNVSYQRAKAENEKHTVTFYPTGDEEILVREKLFSEITDRALNTTVSYMNNTDAVYVDEKFQGRADWADNTVDARSAILHNQGYETKERKFINNLNVMWKKGKDTYAVYSLIAGGNIPENRLSVLSSATDSIVTQTVAGHSFYTRHSTSFIKGFNAHANLSVEVSFETDHDKINSDLTGDNTGGTIQNRNRGYKLISSLLLCYTYSKKRINLTLSSPLQYYHIKYRNGSLSTYNKPVLSPSLKARYRINAAFTVNMSGSVTHTFGDILNFVENPIRRHYLYLSSGESGILMQNRQAKANIGYDYRNTMDGLFSTFLFGYGKTGRNIMKGTTVSETGEVTTMSEGTKNFAENITANFYAAKNFYDIKTVVSFSSGFLSSENRRLRQNRLMTYNNRIWTLMPALHLNPMDWWAVRTSGTLEFISQKTTFGDLTTGSSPEQFRADVELSVLPFSKMEMYCNLVYSNTPTAGSGGSERKVSFFTDCGVRYRASGRIEMNMDFYNLTGQRSYVTSVYREMDKIESTYFIRPRGVMFGCKLIY